MAGFYLFLGQMLFFLVYTGVKCINLTRRIIFAHQLSTIKDISPADEVLPYKRPESDFFSGELFILKTHFEITKYLFSIFKSPNICQGNFQKIRSTSPQNLGGLKAKRKKNMVSFVYPVNASYTAVRRHCTDWYEI